MSTGGDGSTTLETAAWQRKAFLAGAALLLLGAALGYLAPRAFFRAYLVAELFWLGVSLGCLALMMIHQLTGGGWGQRLRDAPVGHFFEVITNGHGGMPSYSAQVPPRDRWAVIAYVRALQYSQSASERERYQKRWNAANGPKGGKP